MEALMRDYSVPATNLLFEAAIVDARERLRLGYGLAGLLYLAPATAEWIRKLLTHKNSRVALETLESFFPAWWEYLRFKAQIETFEEIKLVGHWREFKRQIVRLARRSRDDELVERVRRTISETEQRTKKKQP